MTNRDIALASGLARSTVAKLSMMHSWSPSVSLGTADAFARGCGIDLLAPAKRKDKQLVKKGRMSLFKRSTPGQRRMYQRLLREIGTGPRKRELQA